MEYNKTYENYINYVNRCRDMIKNAFFTKEDAEGVYLGNDGLGINEIVRTHRLKMIDIKLEHTMRMIEQVININFNLGFRIDLELVVKVAVLYHDIGRMRQSTWSNTFNDGIYKKNNMPYNNHSEDGYEIFLNNDFGVDDKYIPIIGQTILTHQNYSVNHKLNYRYDGDLKNINIDDIITGRFQLNEAEWQLAALIVQLVADLDKSDILYQHLSNDFNMIRDYIYDNSRDTLEHIANKWGISKEEIIEFNCIEETNYEPKRVKIPIKNVEIDKLQVPEYMKRMFYDNSWPELQELIRDDNWTFIAILWWRLSHFLNQISFTSVLVNIEESNLLEQIYEKIPMRLRPLVYEAFEYAKEVLVTNKIEQNKGNIYLK